MARGWESKSVELQMDEADRRRASRESSAGKEELRLQSQQESIQLSRERVVRELAESIHPRRKEQLAQALAFLDHQLEELSKGGEKARAASGH